LYGLALPSAGGSQGHGESAATPPIAGPRILVRAEPETAAAQNKTPAAAELRRAKWNLELWKRKGRRLRQLAASTGSSFLVFSFLSFPFLQLVAEDFEDRDFRAIAYADAGVDDVRVAAGPVRKLWRNLAEVLRWWRT
jgi:hypothetical protein